MLRHSSLLVLGNRRVGRWSDWPGLEDFLFFVLSVFQNLIWPQSRFAGTSRTSSGVKAVPFHGQG